MKKLVSFVCIFSLLLASLPLCASEAQTVDTGGLTFGNTVRQEQIDGLTEAEIMVLQREVNGQIVSIGGTVAQSRASILPESSVRSVVTFSEETDYNGRKCLRCVAMVTWYADRTNNKRDYMLLSFDDQSPFIIQPNSYDAYTYYNDPETGERGFDYDRTAVGGIESKAIWYQYNIGLQDIMLVIRTNIYSADSTSTSGSVAASLNYYHAETWISPEDVSLSWPPALNFSTTRYSTSTAYNTYDY